MRGVYVPGGDLGPDVDKALEHLAARATHYLAHPPGTDWKGADLSAKHGH